MNAVEYLKGYNETKQYIHENMKKYYDIAVSITHNSDIRIFFNQKLGTAFSIPEKNYIQFGIRDLPSNILPIKEIVNMVIKGLIAHESAHLILTKPIEKRIEAWIKAVPSKYEQNARSKIFNVLEDIRIEEFLKLRYKYDFGKDIQIMNKILALQIKKNIKSYLHGKKGITFYPTIQTGSFIVTAVLHKFIYNLEIAEIYDLIKQNDDNYKKDLKEAFEIAEEIKYKRIGLDILKLVKRFYEIVRRNTRDIDYLDLGHLLVPSQKGGVIKGDPISEQTVKRLNDKIKKNERKDSEINIKTALSEVGGKGLGDKIPSPKPDIPNYERLKSMVNVEIMELKKLLKKKLEVYHTKNLYQRKGRLMNNLLTRLYVHSKTKPLNRLFLNYKPKDVRHRIALCIMVDFSGSVPKRLAEESLTIVSEAFSDYIPDSQLSILVFGKNYQRIKLFSEKWNYIKARIGGINVDDSGTVAKNCLLDIQKMFNTINHNTIKLLALVSDFRFSDNYNVAIRLNNMEKASRIKTIQIGIGQPKRRFNNKEVKKINSIKELPKIIAELYFKAILNQI